MVAHATKKTSDDDDSFDVSKARLVRVGPRRPGRLSLRALREAHGKTQAQVAKASGLTQPEVSKLETAESLDDRQVLTVRRYLQALGDDLELVATSALGHRIGIAAPARRLTNDEAHAEWQRKHMHRLAPDELLAPEHLWSQLVQNAGLLREVSKSPVKAEAVFLLELCAAKLAGQETMVRDEDLRRALPVLLRSEPGKRSAAMKYRLVAHYVKETALRYVDVPPNEIINRPSSSRWLAVHLGTVDPKFRKLGDDSVARVLSEYRATKSKQGLTDAVTKLCIESRAIDTSSLVDAAGTTGANARRKLRDIVSKALWRK
jgi:transcriptional regulator with XRE-family HTH domain